MVEWYYLYLGRRYLEVELHGETVRLTTAIGFPQGGVCSAKFWLIAFDQAILYFTIMLTHCNYHSL